MAHQFFSTCPLEDYGEYNTTTDYYDENTDHYADTDYYAANYHRKKRSAYEQYEEYDNSDKLQCKNSCDFKTYGLVTKLFGF